MEKTKSKNKALTGIAGAHFVVAEMSRKGYIATVTSRNTEGVDILASNLDGSKLVSIQVKTSSNKYSTRSWILSKKQENAYSKNLFYVFVDLNGEDQMPDFYIIPSEIVADYIKNIYPETKKGLSEDEKKKRREKSDYRLYEIYDDKIAEKYHNKWENLGLGEE